MRGGRLLFEGLSFALERGAAASVTGPNGAGKSSLLRIAASLLPAAAGQVSTSGGIALAAPDATALDGRLPLRRALAFWAGLDDARDDAVTTAMAAMGIAKLAEVPARMLSTGQRRRAALARTIASGAGVWLLDEPGNGLDAAAREQLAAAMAAHRANGGIVLAATHHSIGLADATEIAL